MSLKVASTSNNHKMTHGVQSEMQFTHCGRWHLLSLIWPAPFDSCSRHWHFPLTSEPLLRVVSSSPSSASWAASSLFLFALSHLLSRSPSWRVVKIIESHQWDSLCQLGPSPEYHENAKRIKDGKGNQTLLIQLIRLRQPNLCPLLLLLSLCFSF